MRFSAIFDQSFPMMGREDRAVAGAITPPDSELPPEAVAQGDEDLAERVRRIGEWQLEDW